MKTNFDRLREQAKREGALYRASQLRLRDTTMYGYTKKEVFK